MPVRELRKKHRIQNLAVESHQKRKNGTQRIHGSKRKSAIAHRKMTHSAKVAWSKSSEKKKKKYSICIFL
jgi:hypothetical protein